MVADESLSLQVVWSTKAKETCVDSIAHNSEYWCARKPRGWPAFLTNFLLRLVIMLPENPQVRLVEW